MIMFSTFCPDFIQDKIVKEEILFPWSEMKL